MSAADLTAEFREGAAAAEGSGFADRASVRCPYYATSNAADAWHAGFVFARCDVFALSAADIAQVTRGRGERLNIWPFAAGEKMIATVRWNDPGADPLPPVSFESARGWSMPMTQARRPDPQRSRLELELRAKSPKRADPGKAPAPQHGAGHLPLFIAANEPNLF